MAERDAARPSTAIPEADQLEQEQPADPRAGIDQEWPASVSEDADDADEADRLDQVRPVLTDPDEEYPPATG